MKSIVPEGVSKKRGKKILIIYSSRIPTVEIICNFMSDLASTGEFVIRMRALIEVKRNDIEWSDLILSIRPFDVSAHRIIKAAKLAHREVIVYLDDDLLHLPHIYSSNLRKLFTVSSFKMNCRFLKDVLGMCDVFWGSSHFLVSKYKKLVKSGRCVQTNVGIDIDEMKKPTSRGSEINILYAGSGNHYRQLNEMVIPAINDLTDKHPGIVLTCIGMRGKRIAKCNARVVLKPWQDFDDYYQYIKNTRFDIGVAPVLQEDFYRCKYFNKYIEYTVLGIVGIYTNDYPYLGVIHDHINGLMADNTVESWKERINYAITHDGECHQMVLNAQSDCKSNYGRNSQIKELRECLPELWYEKNDDYQPVKYRPLNIINSARKYANRFVAFYEGLSN